MCEKDMRTQIIEAVRDDYTWDNRYEFADKIVLIVERQLVKNNLTEILTKFKVICEKNNREFRIDAGDIVIDVDGDTRG